MHDKQPDGWRMCSRQKGGPWRCWETLAACCLGLFWRLLGNGTIIVVDEFNRRHKHWWTTVRYCPSPRLDFKQIIWLRCWSWCHRESGLDPDHVEVLNCNDLDIMMLCLAWLVSFHRMSNLKRGITRNKPICLSPLCVCKLSKVFHFRFSWVEEMEWVSTEDQDSFVTAVLWAVILCQSLESETL